jgi:FdhD protein
MFSRLRSDSLVASANGPTSEATMSHQADSSVLVLGRQPERMAHTGLVVMDDTGMRERTDWVVVEEPLEIRAHGPGQAPVSVAVTMRTPGNDAELAVGFLYTEGLIRSRADVVATRDCVSQRGKGACNVVQVGLTKPFDSSILKRNFFASSSCGICGKATLDQIAVRCPRVATGPVATCSVLATLPGVMREAQAVFDRTGGLHAAGLFDAAGRLILVREDVGRHNAVDKLAGRAFLDDELPLADRIMLVSGRTSFEILQKAAMAGIPFVCAVSAPSSMAISVADRLGITLVGFLRGSSFNVYTHPGRIAPHA